LGDLRGARAEAEAIAELLGVKPILGGAATHDRVLMALAEKRHLHFAGHSMYVPGQVFQSGLELSDGLLSVYEVGVGTSAAPHAELVTLSSCWSGMQASFGGYEVVGLANALLAGGAARVLTSGWPVDDVKRVEVMVRVYERLIEPLEHAVSVGAAVVGQMRAGRGDGQPVTEWGNIALHGVS
jgi:CHAT domain-containing protein